MMIFGFFKKRTATGSFKMRRATSLIEKKIVVANEIFRSFPALPTDRELDASKVKDLLITVNADHSSDDSYLISVTNTGRTSYKNLHIIYRDILLWAESFGLDTTHMPSKDQYIAGEPLLIDCLHPDQTVRAIRKGYRTHETYDGARERVVALEYELPDRKITIADKKWCDVLVNLPGARTGTRFVLA